MKFNSEDFKFSEEQFKALYNKLGYDLKGYKFRHVFEKLLKPQEIKFRNFESKFKFKEKMREVILDKFLLVDNSGLFEILGEFSEHFDFINGLDWDTVNEMIDEKARLYNKFILSKEYKSIFFIKFAKDLHKGLYKLYLKSQVHKQPGIDKYTSMPIFKLLLSHTNNNFFVVLTNANGKVLWYGTSGQVCEFYNIKRKRSHFLVKDLNERLEKRLYHFRVKRLEIFVRSNTTRHIQKVVSFINRKRIKTRFLILNRPLPHHFGQRKKKLRRI